jgi:hypothetical protein
MPGPSPMPLAASFQRSSTPAGNRPSRGASSAWAREAACSLAFALLDALAERHRGRGAAHERLAAPDLALVHLDEDVDHARLGRRSGFDVADGMAQRVEEAGDAVGQPRQHALERRSAARL